MRMSCRTSFTMGRGKVSRHSRQAPPPGKILDLTMLTVPGGMERSGEGYAALFEKAGFRLARIVPIASPVSVIEAVPAIR